MEAAAPGPSLPSGDQSAAGDAVWRAVTGRLMGSLRGLLTSEEKIKAGGFGKVLRAPVALALLKLARRLPETVFKLHLQPLLLAVCSTLRSRDSSVRDTARDTLCKIARDLGPAYLKQIVTELKTCLVTGYQLHVRTFTLHVVLEALSDSYKPPNPPSIDARAATAARAARAARREELEGGGEGAGEGRGSDMAPAEVSSLVRPPFDTCVGEIAELLMEDLFGETASAKEADGHNVAQAKLKEAKGQKGLDCFEVIARCLLFRPTFTVLAPEDPGSVSSVHALVGPLLSLLDGCERPRDVGKAHEALVRLGMGLAANPSVTEVEMLLYVHATVAPFLLNQNGESEDGKRGTDESDSESDDESKAAGGGQEQAVKWLASEAGSKGCTRGAALGEKRRREWESIRVLDGASAPKLTGKNRHDSRRRALRGHGGGFGKAKGISAGVASLADPAALGAVKLALGLLHARLRAELSASRSGKRAGGTMDRYDDVVRSMADPFVHLLASCLDDNPHTSIVLLALKSLGLLLRWDLPSMEKAAPLVGRSVLARLVQGGANGMKGEMGQCCFKTLSLLFHRHVNIFEREMEMEGKGGEKGSLIQAGEGKKKRKNGVGVGEGMFGLDTQQLRALLVLLQVAVAESEHQNATFALIKAIVAKRVMLPEVYDLMTKLAELAVTSHRPTLRTIAGQTFLTFLVQYPLGQKRFQQHLNQVLEGVSYEHAEGRSAALNLCEQMFKRLPEPVMDQLSSVFYLALVVRLVNDPATECRAATAVALKTLLTRVSGGIFHQLLEYTTMWFGEVQEAGVRDMHGDEMNRASPWYGAGTLFTGEQEQAKALRRTAAQATGIFVQARPDLIRRGKRLADLLGSLAKLLPEKAAGVITSTTVGLGNRGDLETEDSEGTSVFEWECVYHAIVSVEKVFAVLPGACDAVRLTSGGGPGRDLSGTGLLNRLLEGLLYPHAWVRLATARVWGGYFSRRSPSTLAPGGGGARSNTDSTSMGEVGGGKNRGKRQDQEQSRQQEKQRSTACAISPLPKHLCPAQPVSGVYGKIIFPHITGLWPFHVSPPPPTTPEYTEQVDAALMEQSVKNLVWIGQAMHLNPDLCFTDSNKGGDKEGEGGQFEEDNLSETSAEGDGSDKEEEGDDNSVVLPSKASADPLKWVYNRVSHMVIHKGEARRRAIFSWFFAMASVLGPEVSKAYLPLMLLPLRRAILDAEAGGVEPKARAAGTTSAGKTVEEGQTSAELASEVLELLEEKVGSATFLEVMTQVNMEISQKRVERKRQRAMEKATDPAAAAKRRQARTEASKVRKRRKVEASAKIKGGTKRQRSGDANRRTRGGGGRRGGSRGGGRGR
ncbi:unnamed protein product [Choristocarpus tenellus]